MPDRAYTIKETDALRRVVEHKYLYGSYGRMQSGMSRTYMESDKDKHVEERVRTLMVAGITAEEILAQEKSDA